MNTGDISSWKSWYGKDRHTGHTGDVSVNPYGLLALTLTVSDRMAWLHRGLWKGEESWKAMP